MPKSKAKVLLLTGPCGAGKTTIARLLKRKYNCEVVSGDKIRKKIFGDIKIITTNDIPKIKRVNDEIIKQLSKIILENKLVVVDYIGIPHSLEEYISVDKNYIIKVLMPDKEAVINRDKNRDCWTNGCEFTSNNWDWFNEFCKTLKNNCCINTSEEMPEQTIKKHFIFKNQK